MPTRLKIIPRGNEVAEALHLMKKDGVPSDVGDNLSFNIYGVKDRSTLSSLVARRFLHLEKSLVKYQVIVKNSAKSSAFRESSVMAFFSLPFMILILWLDFNSFLISDKIAQHYPSFS